MLPAETLGLYRAHGGTLPGLLASRAEVDPARALLWCGGLVWSYGEVQAAVVRAAAALAAGGVGRGDRVAVVAPNSADYVVTFLAAAHLGAILVPLSPELRPAELAALLAHAEVRALGTTAETAALADAAGAAAWRFELAGLAHAPAGVIACAAGPDDPCVIIYTSGTTGTPKGVVHPQRTVVMAGEAFVERMHLAPDDRLLCVLPLFHINALFYSLCGTLAAGASLALTPRFSASGFWPLAVASGATEVNLLAAVGGILARRPRSEYRPEHRLAKLYGAPISAALAATFQRDFNIATVIEGYGMTEVPAVSSLPLLGPHRFGSMGQASRFTELCVVDDAGRELPRGEAGELWVRSPLAMRGYHRDPEATAAAFRDGWFATGDLVRLDGDGWLTFVARKKDIIRRRGENISGAELDRVLGEHPAVAEAAAIAVPSELGEDEILAVVVVRAEATLDARELAAHCRAHLAPHKVPRYWVFVAELPHTPSHRVAKGLLRADASLLARAVEPS